ncbi:MAG: DNA mismatch repair protein MutS [Eubacterium sp.]|nr:DNA mismatch repair protein MutS [Eubacterium sp.]
MALSPMMQQYMDIKENYKDCILFFRLGDFYEMFFDDAVTASRELELTLTGKNCGLEERAPMCGVPFHSADNYVVKLIEKGYKVAICEQVEDPSQTKGIVKREVVQIVTPGTITNTNVLKDAENNFLASVYVFKESAGLSYCDITTGEISVCQFSGDDYINVLINELVRISPKEILINSDAEKYMDVSEISLYIDTFITTLDEEYYGKTAMKNAVCKQFEVKSLDAAGIDDDGYVLYALGGQLLYLFETQKQSLSNINTLNHYTIGNKMALDKATIRNLELTETLYEKKVHGSLLGVLDKTHTAMGGRKIKQWLREPLNQENEIKNRLDAVEFLIDEYMIRNNVKESLKAIYDFERLAGRIAYGNANGKDLIALKNSLYVLPEIKYDLENSGIPLLEKLYGEIDTLEDVYKLIDDAIVDDAPFSVKEGGVIKAGYSIELDELKDSIKDAQMWISNLENVERERTGIPNLKVGYNKVFGYYLDITKSHYDRIPDNYIRKQTLANSERFITPELKETEALVLNAETKINQKEYELFTEVRDIIKTHIRRIQMTSRSIATLDVLTSFAEVSNAYGYVKPVITDRDEILIEGGRHPVIEQMIQNGVFVSNDVYMNRDEASMLLITGPNMAGKSTYMRQTALIVLMAQSGCFVPCDAAKIGIVDRIFTRIGASDNLAGGQSTFYVEMSELAYILNNATAKSLVILDEIGRGTSTYDGLSIAWSVAEYLCKSDKRIRTLFASHYHELTVMEETIPGFKNLNVDVSEENGNIVFLHKIVEGSASRSYGIHVAKLAGVPKELLERAEDKLAELENSSSKKLSFEEEQISFKF